MWGYVALYVLFAAGMYLLDRFTKRALFVRTRNRHFRWKLNYSFRAWGVNEYLALTISICMAIMVSILVSHFTDGAVDKTLARWLFAILSLCAILLAARLLRLVDHFMHHKGWLTVLAALLTLWFGLMASAEMDAFILGETRVEPGQFPVAQKMLTFIYLAYIWFISMSSFIPLVILAGVLFFGMFLSGPKRHLRRKKRMIRKKYPKAKVELDPKEWLKGTCVFGLIFTAVILIAASELVRAKHPWILHKALVYASFHLAPEDCALTGQPLGTRLALLETGSVMVAQPLEGGYRYGEQACSLQSNAQIKATSDQRIREARASDAYF